MPTPASPPSFPIAPPPGPLPGVATVPAATVVIFRRAPAGGAPELLMVQRAKAMRFAGGAAVFPGGRIDSADRELAFALSDGRGPDATILDPAALEEIAGRIAAIRETLEETGLAIGLDHPVSAADAVKARAMLLAEGRLANVISQLGWRLAPGLLVPFARWCPDWDGAFDTRFYLTDLGTGAVDIAVDATENTRLFWMNAASALREADKGEISVLYPTRRNLERLAQFANFAEARAHAEATPPLVITPQKIERDGEIWLTIPEGLGYPVLGEPLASVKRG